MSATGGHARELTVIGVEVVFQTGRLQIPVDHDHLEAPLEEGSGEVGKGH